MVEQNELIWSAQKNASSNLDYIVMIVLSAALATLGLLTNSAAVIIGAMLVAPLMSPLSSFSTGMATGILHLTRRASVTLFAGVTLALFISIVMGVVLPIDTPTEEMLARGSPNLLDAAIALVSGWVAAYATARKGIPAALAGVAIAAALMPPICTIGLGIALQDIDLAFGANLLFLANIAFIIAAQYITFLWMGMHPMVDREGTSLNQSRAWWIVLFIITVILLIVFARLGSRAINEAQVREQLETEIFDGAVVSEYHVIASVPLAVTLVVQTDHELTPEQVEAAHQMIKELYQQEVDVTVVMLQIVPHTEGLAHKARSILQAVFPGGAIRNVVADADSLGNPIIRAILTDARAPTQLQLNRALRRINARSESEVRLQIRFEQLYEAGAPQAVMDIDA